MGSAASREAIKAICIWGLHAPRPIDAPSRATETFGSLVFGDAIQKARLPKDVYRALRLTITRGEPLDVSVADAIATAMKDCQIGAASCPPVFPLIMGRLSSLPNHTPPTYLPVKPTNHTSFGPVLVPVLPATCVKSSCARVPVPSVTTLLSM